VSTPPFHLAIALDSTGWHPASRREPGARAADQYGAAFWVDQVREAENGLATFVTIEDGFTAARSPRDEGRTDAVTGDAYAESRRPSDSPAGYGDVSVLLLPYSSSFEGELDRIRAGVRESSLAYVEAAERLIDTGRSHRRAMVLEVSARMRIGAAADFAFLKVGTVGRSVGRSAAAALSAACTSRAALSMLRLRSN